MPSFRCISISTCSTRSPSVTASMTAASRSREVIGEQHHHLESQHLARVVTEYPLCAAVPGHDVLGQVETEHRVGRCLDERVERRDLDCVDLLPPRRRDASRSAFPDGGVHSDRWRCALRVSRLDDDADLAGAALTMARRFASGATMWCLAPEWPEHGRHVAVEFVHPVIMGKRALPSVSIEGTGTAARLRSNARSGDIVLAVASASDPTVCDLMRRAPAWGVTSVWIGTGPRPPSRSADYVLWSEEAVGARPSRRLDGVRVPRAVGARARVLRAPGASAVRRRHLRRRRDLHHLLGRGKAG